MNLAEKVHKQRGREAREDINRIVEELQKRSHGSVFPQLQDYTPPVAQISSWKRKKCLIWALIPSIGSETWWLKREKEVGRERKSRTSHRAAGNRTLVLMMMTTKTPPFSPAGNPVTYVKRRSPNARRDGQMA